MCSVKQMNALCDDSINLEGCTITGEDGFICISSDEIRLNSVYGVLRENGYKDEKEIDKGHPAKLWVSRRSESWDGSVCPLFDSLEDLWKSYRLMTKAPLFFHYFGNENTQGLSVKLEIYFAWKRVLLKLADHEGAKGRSHSYIFFVETEKSPKKFEIDPVISLDELIKIDGSPEIEKTIKNLEAALNLEDEDVHSKERKHVMRSSLAEITEKVEPKNSLRGIANQTAEFHRKYRELYDLYVRQFSVKKLLNEIDEKTSDYLVKIQDSISSSQTKAYAIPGALIGIGALVKSPSMADSILVLIGLAFVWYITRIANSISKEAYDLLKSQIEKSFSRYNELPDGNSEVKASAADRKADLDSMIDKAIGRLRAINCLSMLMFLIGSAYLFRSAEIEKLLESPMAEKLISLAKSAAKIILQ